MQFWRDKISKLDSLVTDEVSLTIFHIGCWLGLFMYLTTNAVEYFSNEQLAGRVFWFNLALCMFCLSVPFRSKTWITQSFFILASYNIFDEIMGRGMVLQWYEFPFAFCVALFSWLKFKKGWIF